MLERCDGDSVTVDEVLPQIFCAQGLIHIEAMHQSKVVGDHVAALFHMLRYAQISPMQSMPSLKAREATLSPQAAIW